MKSGKRSVLTRFLSPAALVLFAAFAGHVAHAQPAKAVTRPALDDLGDITRFNRCSSADFLNANPDADDCCKLCGNSIGLNAAEMKCCLDSKATRCFCLDKAECEKNEDCDDKNPCTDDKCVGIPATDFVGSKPSQICVHDKIPNCVDECGKLYTPGTPSYQCCKDGFSEASPDEWKCCIKHASAGELTRNADGKPNPCPDGGCPECPRCPPKISCDLVKNDDLKKCCKEEKGYLFFMMKECLPDKPTPDACKDFFNVVAGGDVTINIECSNICCNNCSAVGDYSFASCHQDCMVDCSGGPGGGTTGGVTGGTPTTPSGSATALTCSVALVGEPVEGKFEISYTVPASAGPVVSATLTQVSGSQIRVEGEAEPADFGATVTEAKSMSTKSISDPNNPPKFTVFAPTPKSMAGEWKAPFEVKVALNTLEGEAGSALCTESHFLHAEGTGCGCAMTARLTGREQLLAYLVMALFFAAPVAALRLVRKR